MSWDDTVNLARGVCPVCEPESALSTEITETKYCFGHAPKGAGADDARSPLAGIWIGVGEADGENARAIQALIR